jgi:Xaa-Pro aminopeptidase
MSTSIARARRTCLADAMTEHGVDLLLIYGNAWQIDYLRYATDYGPLEGEGLALVRSDGAVTLYLDSPIEAERAEVETHDIEIVHAASMLADVEAVLERARQSRIGTAPGRLMPQRLAARGSDLGMVDCTAIIDRLLMKKLDCEIAAMREAAHLADEGYEVFRRAARVGRADYELVAEVEAFFRTTGVDDNFMIIGVGGKEVRGMAPPTGKILGLGDLVTTELTPCVDGYYLQICRTLVLGAASAAQAAAFAIYRKALEAGLAAIGPGSSAADVARAENDVFRRYGLGDYVTNQYTRVRGHGLGLFADTKPHILEDVVTPLEENMTIIVHPNTYHPEVGYMVLGDAVIVTADGFDPLLETPRELFAVGGG